MPVLKRYTDDDRERVRVKAEEARKELESTSSWSLHDYRYHTDDHLNQAFPGERWGIAPFVYWDASGDLALDESNFQAAYKRLEVHNDRVVDITIGHFVGGVPVHMIVIPTDDVDVIDEVVEIIGELESYAVLDDEDYDDRVHRAWMESLTWHDDVDESNVGDIALYLANTYDIHDESDGHDLDELVSEAMLKLGLREPDEDEEDPFTAVEEAFFLLTQLGLTWPELHPIFRQLALD